VARDRIIIYGANGYTGVLVARRARERGLRPVLAGRSPEVRALAAELGFEGRIVGLDDEAALDAGLQDALVVLHCAGPFSRTSQPMADACLRGGIHYVDITGEAAVFEALHARDAEARQRGVMLLPGAGMDVVPTDCLAAHLKRRLAGATRLALAFRTTGGISRGTATTMLENLPKGGLVRRGGRLERVPVAWRTREIDYGRGPRLSMTIPWGDVSTAFHSTGIPDVEVYTESPRSRVAALRLLRPFLFLLERPALRAFFKRRIDTRGAGPDDARRARGRAFFWGEVEDAAGRRAISRQETPEGYSLTALTVVGVAERVLNGEAPAGFQTPSSAYGADFILEFEGCSREDVGAAPPV
jgi:short subunit dehydrogenase-like uncharacterized protein